MKGTANVIGAGPNGLSAAIVLAQAGLKVRVFEAEAQPGGAARTLPLTLPGFHHDFGSAIHAMGVGSPFFQSLPLADHGLEWIHPSTPLAHPLDDGTAVMLERSIDATAANLGPDGNAWRQLFSPIADNWFKLAPDLLGPVLLPKRHPILLARFGLHAFAPATWLANRVFQGQRAKAIFAGLAAHSFLALNELMTSAFGIMLGAAAHAVGWPIARGGSQAVTNALCSYLATLGGTITTGARVESLADLPPADITMCDVTPRQLLQIAGDRLSPEYRRRMERWRYGPAAFKVDYALSEPIPWRAKECLRTACVHVGGTLEEVAESEAAMSRGHHAERPFVLVVQPTLFDSSRAPEGKHVGWAYCHVPNGSTFDMLPRLEAQIERFAPGFRDCILARRVFSPADLEAHDANLVGGDIGGGSANLRQFLFRPTGKNYSTSAPEILLCSSSTPPGGGVHGMCGFNAAKRALATVTHRK